MTDSIFFVMAPGDKAPILTVCGLRLCDNVNTAQESVGESRLSLALDEGLDYFQVEGAAARERLSRA